MTRCKVQWLPRRRLTWIASKAGERTAEPCYRSRRGMHDEHWEGTPLRPMTSEPVRDGTAEANQTAGRIGSRTFTPACPLRLPPIARTRTSVAVLGQTPNQWCLAYGGLLEGGDSLDHDLWSCGS